MRLGLPIDIILAVFWTGSRKTSATASQNLTASHSPRATVKAGDTVEAVQSKALEQDGPTQEKLTQVRVVNSTAQNHNAYLEVSGETAFNRKVMVKSNIVGRVEELHFEKGALVREKDLIACLDLRDRTAQIRHWEALVALRKLQNDAAQKLQKRAFSLKFVWQSHFRIWKRQNQAYSLQRSPSDIREFRPLLGLSTKILSKLAIMCRPLVQL